MKVESLLVGVPTCYPLYFFALTFLFHSSPCPLIRSRSLAHMGVGTCQSSTVRWIRYSGETVGWGVEYTGGCRRVRGLLCTFVFSFFGLFVQTCSTDTVACVRMTLPEVLLVICREREREREREWESYKGRARESERVRKTETERAIVVKEIERQRERDR